MKNSPAKRPVVFYFPYPSVGGVSVLFLRLAKLLCKQRRIILMDLENGYMAKHRPKNVEFILYSEPEMLPENSIVVFQSVPPWRIPFIAKFPKKATIFFWNLHPDNLRPDFIGIGSKFKGINLLFYPFTAIRKRKLNKLIKLLLKNNAIRFMDKENLLSTASFYNIDGDRLSYLQILTDDYLEENICDKKLRGSTLNFAWFGRVEGFKTPILSHLIERLSRIRSMDIKLKVIGTGKDIKKIQKECKKYNNIQFQFVAEVPFDCIQETMDNIDILFAMGTCALDGAKNKVPTLLVDFSYEKIKGLYKFKMIYEKQNYNMGEMINISHMEIESSLADLLDDIIQNYGTYSERTYLYWKNNFSPDIVIPKFIYTVDSSTFQFKDLFKSNVQHPDIITVLKDKIHDKIKPGMQDDGWQYS